MSRSSSAYLSSCLKAGLLAGVAIAANSTPTFAVQPVETVTVTAERLAAARNGIQTQTGASTYTVTAKDIENQPGGDNTALNQVILQTPGVAQDSFGQLHIRGEHNGLQYRINGIILPEGISVFGQTLDPRLAESVRLIDGALPAEYGNRTAGIIDIQTKTGLFDTGGEISLYGGSHGTLHPSISYGGSAGSFNYFVSGDYTTNTLGIESPDGSSDPQHDRTKQYHAVRLRPGHPGPEQQPHRRARAPPTTCSRFPTSVGLQPTGLDGIVGLGPQNPDSGDYVLKANGQTAFPSAESGRAPARDHRLRHSQLSALGRGSWIRRSRCSAGFPACTSRPAPMSGDILYDGLAQTAYKRDVAYGLQAEGAWHAGDHHTVRFGLLYQADDILSAIPHRWSCPPMPAGPAAPIPIRFAPIPPRPARSRTSRSRSSTMAASMPGPMAFMSRTSGRLLPSLTLNYGLRYDQYRRLRCREPVQPARQSGVDADRHHHHACRLSRATSRRRRSNWWQARTSPCSTTPPRPATIPTTRPRPSGPTITTWAWCRSCSTGAQLGLDSFFKASHNLIDEGQFGAPIILTPFNYLTGPAIWRRIDASTTSPAAFPAMSTPPMSGRTAATSSPASSSSIPAIWPISPTIISRWTISRSAPSRRAPPITWNGIALSAPTCFTAPACAATGRRPMATMSRPIPPSISASATVSMSAASRA